MDDGDFTSEPIKATNDIILKSSTGEPQLTITILRSTGTPSIHTLLQDDILHRRTIFSKQLSKLSESNNAYIVQTIDQFKTPRTGLLQKCLPFAHAYELFVFSRPETSQRLTSTSAIPPACRNQDEFLEDWKILPNDNVNTGQTLSNFSMRPPPAYLSPMSDRNAVITQLSPQSETDPINFLKSRYFSILYSLSTPLTYFPKSTLTRLRVMCDGKKELMEQSLAAVYLSPESLNERHRLRYGLDVLIGKDSETMEINKYEAENQKLLLQKHFTFSMSDEARNRVIFDLKRREAQLQILLVMQLLLTWEVDEASFLASNAKLQEKMNRKVTKKSLVRRKSKTKKITPTLLGVGIHEKTEDPDQKKNHITHFGLYASLVALVDQMSIWDVLTGKLKNKKDESIYGFLAYVFVPFFNTKLPKIVKFVIEKVRESRPTFKSSKLKTSTSKSVSGSEAGSPPSTDEVAPKETKKASRFNKKLLTEKQKPFLRRSKTSASEKDEPAFSLKRSKSNLGSKNLKRRQVDMSLNKPDDQDVAEKATSFIFGDARKVKNHSVSMGMLSKNESNEIPDEPIKLIQATPSTKRISNIILETPQNSEAKRKDFVVPDSTKRVSLVQQKLSLLAAPSLPDVKIVSSPIHTSSEKSPVLFSQHATAQTNNSTSSVIESSPIQPETTLPARKAKMTDFKNPFTQATLQGSPGRPPQEYKKALRTVSLPSKSDNSPEIFMPITKPASRADGSLLKAGNSMKAPSIEPSKSGDTDVDSDPNQESDSDSDFEKLLASTSNRTVKTYVRPKRR
ncbi:uncharacterized protein CXQ87_000697 [Candidozyma duobushaemuli]|uniref:DNA replication regulator Sld3 C-terminal domain-containing protein n=2 Tax=Candidozyma TaxID=3303203 RepID=A0ABX8I052_9ASCO|nr:uncharacterized protein CXQ87_000697 [[Candida] duobushaemulonis]PVH17799.1 hypothetical protein CXQ87_000697 [[Candida] duobushaemulonis]QWU86399.1 hypothetical protein CA3LBN_000617 [[Candida] haemuloni]